MKADLNRDGYLDRFEFSRVLKQVGDFSPLHRARAHAYPGAQVGVTLASDELDRLLSSLDVNADGRVSCALRASIFSLLPRTKPAH